jgi:hypothetical protein
MKWKKEKVEKGPLLLFPGFEPATKKGFKKVGRLTPTPNKSRTEKNEE